MSPSTVSINAVARQAFGGNLNPTSQAQVSFNIRVPQQLQMQSEPSTNYFSMRLLATI